MRTCASRVFIVGLILTVSACAADDASHVVAAAAAETQAVVTTSLGSLTGEGLPTWPTYAAAADESLEFGSEISVTTGVRREKLDLFDVINAPATN